MADKKTDDIVEEANVTEAEQSVDESDSEEIVSEEELVELKGPNAFQKLLTKFLAWYKAHKKVSIPATAVVALIIIFAVPLSRYTVLGLVIKKDVSVTVLDKQTNVPVSGVDLSIRGKTAKTDGEGKATLKGVKLGKAQLKATKKYYKDNASTTLIGLGNKAHQIAIEATGRQVPVHVVNKITGQNVAGVQISAADTEAMTDQNGETTIVMPADQQKVSAKLKAKDYNDQTVDILVRGANVKDNTFNLTPAGQVYFLSKKSGKIDVVKTDLDGANRQTVLAGTGTEEDTNTVLLATRDWQYLALLSRRDGTKPTLYLIETASGQLTEIDSGDATFSLIGWSGHSFIYQVARNSVKSWQPKGNALKTYNAEAKQLTTLDETNAEGGDQNDYAAESFGSVYILKDTLLYTKRWYASYYSVYRLAGKRMGIYTVKPTGGNKQTVKDFDVGNNGYINVALSEPNELYFGIYNTATVFYAYEDGKLTETKDVKDDSFNRQYPTFLLSPSGNATLWVEPRDGKNTLFIGNSDAGNPKELAALSEYKAYGWYGDDYILLSKNGSELYIQPSAGVGTKGQILKISDYHKPSLDFYGYGGGYGGL